MQHIIYKIIEKLHMAIANCRDFKLHKNRLSVTRYDIQHKALHDSQLHYDSTVTILMCSVIYKNFIENNMNNSIRAFINCYTVTGISIINELALGTLKESMPQHCVTSLQSTHHWQRNLTKKWQAHVSTHKYSRAPRQIKRNQRKPL